MRRNSRRRGALDAISPQCGQAPGHPGATGADAAWAVLARRDRATRHPPGRGGRAAVRASRRGDTDKALVLAEEAISAYRTADALLPLAAALSYHGWLLHDLGRHDEAAVPAEAAVDRYRVARAAGQSAAPLDEARAFTLHSLLLARIDRQTALELRVEAEQLLTTIDGATKAEADALLALLRSSR